MTATDHLNRELFHATTHPFQIGDVVNPTDTEHSETPMAFATPDLGLANSIARGKARWHNKRNPDDQRTGHVFAVEHMSEPADLWMPSRYVADPAGFRVVRKVEQ
jgi:hypothetical protein